MSSIASFSSLMAAAMLLTPTGPPEKAVVGLARVTKAAYPDPKAKDPKLLVVELAPVKPVTRQVRLAEIKADVLFRDSPLVRQGRLSVVPLTDDQFARLR